MDARKSGSSSNDSRSRTTHSNTANNDLRTSSATAYQSGKTQLLQAQVTFESARSALDAARQRVSSTMVSVAVASGVDLWAQK